MHLVYYLQNPGEEFRYSLRSVAQFLPVERLTVIGDAPSWLKFVKPISGNPTADPKINSVANAHIAARNFPDEFVMMNDDFFALQKTEEIPHWYRALLTEHAGLYSPIHSADWRKLYLDTAKYLTWKRVVSPKSFELHVPMRVIGAELDSILTVSARERMLEGPGVWRSLYGNLSPSVRAEGIVQRTDVKVHSLRHQAEFTDFISTDERTIKPVLTFLRDKFPERSPWEKR